MSLGDALLTFVSVFVAALLAFYLDGLRERRATRAWIREYLGFWRSLLDSGEEEREANAAGVRRVEAALDDWLAAGPGSQPTWRDVDAININATVRFTGPLLSNGGSVVPPALLQRMFVADGSAPALTTQSDFVTRLFETEVRPLVLGRVVPLEGRDREAVELYRREFHALVERMDAYGGLLSEIREELVQLGY